MSRQKTDPAKTFDLRRKKTVRDGSFKNQGSNFNVSLVLEMLDPHNIEIIPLSS